MIQPTVVAAFHDAAAARSAAERLASSGVDDRDISLHRDDTGAATPIGLETDELLTGGMVSTFRHLLEALMAQKASIGDEVAYRALLPREGVLLSVKVADSATGQAIGTALQAAGADRIAMLPQPDLEQPPRPEHAQRP